MNEQIALARRSLTEFGIGEICRMAHDDEAILSGLVAEGSSGAPEAFPIGL